MPKISVIIPAYNAESTILETVDSLLQQTFKDFELIIINDGSTDQTLDVLNQVKDSRIKVFSYENGGLPVARNRGIFNALGEYISFIDADDLWTSDKLEKQLEALSENSQAGVAYSWTLFINQRSELLYRGKQLFFEGDVYRELLLQNFISSGSNILVHRKYIELVGEFDPFLKSSEDWDYYTRLAKQCSFAVVPQYQILYRKSAQSMSSKVDVMEQALLTVINRMFQSAPPELQFLKQKSLANAYKFFAKLHLEHTLDKNKIEQASRKFKKAVNFNKQILLERETQNILIKLILLQVLPYNLGKNTVEILTKLARKERLMFSK